ncbi:MAG: hypothetical protein K6L75_08900 [Cellvibrionaceae bacterium]
MHNDEKGSGVSGESDVGELFKRQLEISEKKYQDNELTPEDSVSQALKRINHQTGARDLLVLLVAGSFTFLVALMAPFCVKRNLEEKD